MQLLHAMDLESQKVYDWSCVVMQVSMHPVELVIFLALADRIETLLQNRVIRTLFEVESAYGHQVQILLTFDCHLEDSHYSSHSLKSLEFHCAGDSSPLTEDLAFQSLRGYHYAHP